MDYLEDLIDDARKRLPPGACIKIQVSHGEADVFFYDADGHGDMSCFSRDIPAQFSEAVKHLCRNRKKKRKAHE